MDLDQALRPDMSVASFLMIEGLGHLISALRARAVSSQRLGRCRIRTIGIPDRR